LPRRPGVGDHVTVLPILPRTFAASSFDADVLAAQRGDTRISVCLPARDEEATIGQIVTTIRRELVERVALVEEVVVLDDGSSDRTARIARDAGAAVFAAGDVLPEHASGPGKGQALWRSLHASVGDIVVWCDADIVDFDPRFVTGLVGPLLDDAGLVFVKGCYDRSTESVDGGGRVTELVARPVLSLLHPDLVGFQQPLAGEFAGRRAALEQVPFVDGYGVDLGLVIDLVRQFGARRVAQVDLGARRHRNRPLGELSPQALEVLHVALERAGVTDLPTHPVLWTAEGEELPATVSERPPLASLDASQRATA
jgi:glucosyl-3-phosphoglycerate synthase